VSASSSPALAEVELGQFQVAGLGNLQINLRAEATATGCSARSTTEASYGSMKPSAGESLDDASANP